MAEYKGYLYVVGGERRITEYPSHINKEDINYLIED